jgi:hypothetical protein
MSTGIPMMITLNVLVTSHEFTFLGPACNREQSSCKGMLADMQGNKCGEANFSSKAQQLIGLHAVCKAVTFMFMEMQQIMQLDLFLVIVMA